MRHFSGETNGIRLLMEDELERVAGGEGEDTDDVQSVDISAGFWQNVTDLGKEALKAWLGSQIQNAGNVEANNIGYTFNPSDVATTGTAWQNDNGINHEVPAWQMNNGDMWTDTNQNGVPDTVMRIDPSGGVWTNNTGTNVWTQIYSPGS